MLARILVITVLILMMVPGAAYAQTGHVLLIDMAYGAAIGALLGAAVYAFDDEHLGEKVFQGAAIGVIGGFVYGVTEVTAFVEVENNEVKFAAPAVVIEKDEESVTYKAGIFKYRY